MIYTPTATGDNINIKKPKQLETKESLPKTVQKLNIEGVDDIKFRVRDSGNRINALMQMMPKGEHLQTAMTQMRRRETRRLIRVCAVCP